MSRRRALRRRYGRARLPKGQHTFTIKIGGFGRHAGEYVGAATVPETARMAREQFVPHLDEGETVKVVHFDRSGTRAIVDLVVRG